MKMFKKSRRVWRYIILRAVHNALPYFAVVAATGSLMSWPSLIVLATIFTGMLVDVSFWDALEGEGR